MKKFKITGMTCAACSARVEKAVAGLGGVASCSVNLLTNSMVVDSSLEDSEIIAAVLKAGYGAQSESGEKNDENKEEKSGVRKMLTRLVASCVILAVLMYFSMGHAMWGFPVPAFFDGNYLALALLQMILSAMIIVINQKFFISGTLAIKNRAPNMDTLIALGSGAAFIWSVYVLFMMTDTHHGEAMEHLHNLYFESSAMILTLITVGKALEEYSKGKTTSAIKSLMELSPKMATVIEDGVEKKIAAADVEINDIFVVRPGEAFPVDGVVLEGTSTADESALTGESIPCEKEEGSKVSAGAVNLSGFLKCRAVRVGEDTMLSQIIKTVTEASAQKAPIAKIADKVSGVFVPIVLIIALLTLVIWLILGKEAGFALARGISVLVISCPCALGLATPVAIMVASGVGARCGVLFKTASALEVAGKTEIVVLDKTGTVTKGEPSVTDIVCAKDVAEDELLEQSYAIESKSEHPLAAAIVKKAEEVGIKKLSCDEFEIYAGNGLSAKVENSFIVGGNANFIEKMAKVDAELKEKAEMLAQEGKTPMFFSKDEKVLGIIAVADTVKEESRDAVAELKNMGIRVIMVTGDNEKTAKAIADSVGIDEVTAGVLPTGKEAIVSALKKEGKVMMVGDGINDTPALTAADIGVAIGRGTDIAIDAADVVLAKSKLTDVCAAIRLSRKTLLNIKENLFWAFIYNAIGIPLAAGVFINAWGWEMNPMFGAAAMSLSSFCVVTNALRLNFANIYSKKYDRKIKRNKNNKKEKTVMEKTLKVEGMMCSHCEARVKESLMAVEGVLEVNPSHEKKQVVVKMEKEIPENALKEVIEAQGYNVIE